MTRQRTAFERDLQRDLKDSLFRGEAQWQASTGWPASWWVYSRWTRCSSNDIVSDIMKRIIIQIEDDVLEELDEAAHEGAESRASFARRVIEAALAERRRRRELQRVVDSFRRRPPEDLTASKAAVRRAWPD